MTSPEIPLNETERLKNLFSYGIIDTVREEEFDNITRLASDICGTPMSFISFIDEHRQWFKSSYGLDIQETAREYSFCAHAINSPDQILEVYDASKDKRFIGNPLVEYEPHIRFYAGAPLLTKEGHALGTLCVIDNEPNSLSEKQKNELRLLARQVVLKIDTRKEQMQQKSADQSINEHDFGLALFNEKGVLVYNNNTFHQMMSIAKPKIGLTKFTDVVSNGKAANIKDYINSSIPIKVEKKVKGDAGIERLLEVEYVHLTIDKKEYVQLICKAITKPPKNQPHLKERFSDVSATHQDLVQKMEVLEELQMIAKIGFWELDVKSNTIKWSDVTKEIFEVAADYQPKTGPGVDFFEGKYKKSISETIAIAIANGEGWNEKLPITTAKGKKKWVKSAGQCFVQHGETTKVFGLLTDLSEHIYNEKKIIKNEERLKLLTNNTNDMVGLHKLDGRFIYVSPACKSILGYEPSELIGKDPYVYYHPEDIIKIRDTAHAPVLEKDNEIKIEYRMRHKSGHYVWLETLSKPIVRKGEKEAIITSSRDISERIAIQESLAKNYRELEKAKDRAEEAAQAKKQFLATMSHEIRTPLNAINGLAHILLLDDPKKDQIDNLKLLKFSGDNLLSLINDILDISKIDTGKLSLNNEAFDLNYVLENIYKSLKIKADENKVNLQLKIDKSLPLIFISDKNRISQIVYNLVGNALKFTKDGEVTLYTEALGKMDSKYKFRVGVKDTGIGISKKNQEKIFSAFEQADSDISRRYGGTGLGLYISGKLLKLMGSEIQLESLEKVGSHFYFDLLLEQGTLDVKPIESDNLDELKNKDIKILIVEDNLANQLIIKKFMKLYQLNFALADDGKQALERVKDKSFNLVLMDLHMPIMDGYMATKIIRNLKDEYFKRIPIVALTADAFQEVKNKTESTGMDDYLSKPFKPTELVEIILRYYGTVEHLKKQAKGPSTVTAATKEAISMLALAANKLEEGINALCEGDLAFKLEFCHRFMENLKEFQQDLFYVVEQNNLEQLKNSFHKLKSILVVLKLEDLQSEITNLIDSWDNFKNKKQLTDQVSQLLGTYIQKLDGILKKG